MLFPSFVRSSDATRIAPYAPVLPGHDDPAEGPAERVRRWLPGPRRRGYRVVKVRRRRT
ncbi:protein of unknown function [Streptomyces sp. KY75]|nr:protein of unknown function [Streptomyces sp. KY70]CAD5994372.1 protein of unknown function [Streptomyces sp. KY75]